MNVLNRLVVIVEDDVSLKTALERMLIASGHAVRAVSNAEELLSSLALQFDHMDRVVAEQTLCCILLDVGLSGIDGIEAQLRVKNKYPDIPIVFMSGVADKHLVNQAWRDGAFDFIFKPFQSNDLLALLELAFQHHMASKAGSIKIQSATEAELVIPESIEALTPRELQILQYVSEGNKNQKIAEILGISLRTVKMHRANLMRKIQCTHVAELVKFYERTRGVS